MSDAIARAYGYPPSRPPSAGDRIEHLEHLAAWLEARLDLLEADIPGAGR